MVLLLASRLQSSQWTAILPFQLPYLLSILAILSNVLPTYPPPGNILPMKLHLAHPNLRAPPRLPIVCVALAQIISAPVLAAMTDTAVASTSESLPLSFQEIIAEHDTTEAGQSRGQDRGEALARIDQRAVPEEGPGQPTAEGVGDKGTLGAVQKRSTAAAPPEPVAVNIAEHIQTSDPSLAVAGSVVDKRDKRLPAQDKEMDYSFLDPLDPELEKILNPTVTPEPISVDIIDGADDEDRPAQTVDEEYNINPFDGFFSFQPEMRVLLEDSQSAIAKDPHGEPPEQSQASPLSTPGHSQSTSPKRYLMVDFRLEMGIGEVRSALEHALYASHLTGRTLVLPQFLYFRGCVHPMLCRRTMDEIQLDAVYIKNNNSTLRAVPRWPIPFQQIYDVERMKRYVDVIMVEDWVQMMISEDQQLASEIDTTLAKKSGLAWLREHRQYEYHPWKHNELLGQFHNVTVHERNIHSFLYHSGVTVLDTLSQGTDQKDVLRDSKQTTVFGHNEFPSRSLNGTGRWILAAPKFVGFKETFSHLNETVLYLRGGITEYGRQMLKFSTIEARDAFENVATKWVQPSARIRLEAIHLCRNLLKFTGGRTFLGVHFRRGPEFMNSYIPGSRGNLNRYRMGQNTRDPGSVLLKINMFMTRDTTVGPFNPGDLNEWAVQEQDLHNDGRMNHDNSSEPNAVEHPHPQQGSTPFIRPGEAGQTLFASDSLRERHFFLATDERSPEILGQMKDQGAIVLGDLMDEDFIIRNLDWMGFPDYFALLDQMICTKARLFLGSPMSVFSGAIINQRIGHHRHGRSGNGWLYQPVPLTL